jgi:hypothetical protein
MAYKIRGSEFDAHRTNSKTIAVWKTNEFFGRISIYATV